MNASASSAAFSAARTASAPLPSPTQQRPQFFSSLTTSSMQTTSSSTSTSSSSSMDPASQYQTQSQLPMQEQGQSHGQQSAANQQPPYSTAATSEQMFEYVPDRSGAGSTAHETARVLSEYALVAEAAKRAQMAVLMRDMEGVELV